MLTSYPLGIAGILAAIVTAALYLAVVFVTLYGILCLLIVTLREFIASVIISLIPTVILAVVVLVVDSLFPDLSDTIANLSMFGLILALMVVSNIIRSRMEEDAEIEIDRIEEARKTKRERRANTVL